MTVSRRTTVVTAAALSAILALAACNGAEPVVGPTGSSSSTSSKTTTAPPTTTTTSKATTTTPTPTVDPVLAKIPKAARPETMQGAEAFASFYMEQVNEAFTTGTPMPLDGLYDSSCKVCVAFRDGAQDMKVAGEKHQGQSLEVTASSSIKFTTETRTVGIWLTQHSVPVVNSSGKTLRMTKGAKGVFLATLAYRGHWTISRLQVAK